MSKRVWSFDELEAEQMVSSGGKGGALARLYQADFPVTDGFVIMPTAFVDDELTADAWMQVQDHLAPLRQADPETAFAVRSSALAEDSAEASFAGEFETVLNVRTNEEIRQAIQTVFHSRVSERVRVYTQARGRIKDPHIGTDIDSQRIGINNNSIYRDIGKTARNIGPGHTTILGTKYLLCNLVKHPIYLLNKRI